MTTPSDVFGAITERLRSAATVATVYGEPIHADGKTIVPVARVRYGFGGGSGSGSKDDDDAGGQAGEGFGGGGGVEVTPIGIIEITADRTQYISLEGPQRIVKAITIVAALIAFLVWRRLRKR